VDKRNLHGESIAEVRWRGIENRGSLVADAVVFDLSVLLHADGSHHIPLHRGSDDEPSWSMVIVPRDQMRLYNPRQ
jgi:hypothetical protein